jgi:hypothetical protein
LQDAIDDHSPGLIAAFGPLKTSAQGGMTLQEVGAAALLFVGAPIAPELIGVAADYVAAGGAVPLLRDLVADDPEVRLAAMEQLRARAEMATACMGAKTMPFSVPFPRSVFSSAAGNWIGAFVRGYC